MKTTNKKLVDALIARKWVLVKVEPEGMQLVWWLAPPVGGEA
jgi:hypothetical protein